MPFRNIYKVLVVADQIATRTPMRLHGAAILAQLRDEQHLEVTMVQNTLVRVSERASPLELRARRFVSM